MDYNSSVSFHINGLEYTVSENELPPSISLNEYLRDVLGLKGTKVMCREGGCGVCAVTVTIPSFTNQQQTMTFSINSCLCPLFCVDGWKVRTIEGLGDQASGPHPLQKRISDLNGSQCGYCTPGMVMNMYGLLHQNPKPNQEFIEDNFDGNICRCTGYRPILDAMKSFATDSKFPGSGCIDIEDLDKKMCSKTNKICRGTKCRQVGPSKSFTNHRWYRPHSMKKLQQIVQMNSGKNVRYVFGYTSSGVFKEMSLSDMYVDIRYIPELIDIKLSADCVTVGANTTLTRLISILSDRKSHHQGFSYFTNISQHLKKIGNVLVRNAGSWAGNLMMKHEHPEFPSDVFVVLEAAGAIIEVQDLMTGTLSKLSLMEFLQTIMKNKLIIRLYLYPHQKNTVYQSFKIMARSQNVYAYVNAGFRFKLSEDGRQFTDKPSIVYGGLDVISHAVNTEHYLCNKMVTDSVIQEAVSILRKELTTKHEDENILLSSYKYRCQLAVNLFYKTMLGIMNQDTLASNKTGAVNLSREISSGQQTYQTNTTDYPLKQPMVKLASLAQACGEVIYVDDMPMYRDEIYAGLVLSTVANSTITNIDFSQAMVTEGVIDVVTVDDIPKGGINQYLPSLGLPVDLDLQILCNDTVHYAGQIIAVIIAESRSVADAASETVQVSYKQHSKPILSIKDAIKHNSFETVPFPEKVRGRPSEIMSAAPVVTCGECEWGTQYHFYLENQSALCVPVEDGLDIYSTTQCPDILQRTIAKTIAQPTNYVHVTVPRVGGSFGGKGYSNSNIATCCALAAYKTKRPVRMHVKMEDAMAACGKRFPILAKYKVGHDKNGRILSVIVDLYCDMGWKASSAFFAFELMSKLDQGYNIENWLIRPHLVRTHKPPQSACRSPGCFPAGFIIESIVEHVTSIVKQHPIIVKELNLYQEGQVDINGDILNYCTLPTLWKQLKQMADVNNRLEEIKQYNKLNTWKKRGLTMTPVKYGINGFPFRFTCEISIYGSDGSINISQGGVEMGQGLYTKVIQAVAATLNVPISFIRIRPCSTLIAPNNLSTGNSVGSELCVQAAIECCEILKKRMLPVQEANPNLDWVALCDKCYMSCVDLTTKYTQFGIPSKDLYYKYFTYATGVTEVEVDILTGENHLRRVDILFDCGESLNPTIDIGQIEGAYVMGLGAMLTEDTIYNPETGQVLNNGTWDYKPPTSKDIPIDWRIHLLSDAPNPVGIKGSKATGEPPIVLSTGSLFAIKQAINSFNDDNNSLEFSPTVAPLTVEKIQQSCAIISSNLSLNETKLHNTARL